MNKEKKVLSSCHGTELVRASALLRRHGYCTYPLCWKWRGCGMEIGFQRKRCVSECVSGLRLGLISKFKS